MTSGRAARTGTGTGVGVLSGGHIITVHITRSSIPGLIPSSTGTPSGDTVIPGDLTMPGDLITPGAPTILTVIGTTTITAEVSYTTTDPFMSHPAGITRLRQPEAATECHAAA